MLPVHVRSRQTFWRPFSSVGTIDNQHCPGICAMEFRYDLYRISLDPWARPCLPPARRQTCPVQHPHLVRHTRTPGSAEPARCRPGKGDSNPVPGGHTPISRMPGLPAPTLSLAQPINRHHPNPGLFAATSEDSARSCERLAPPRLLGARDREPSVPVASAVGHPPPLSPQKARPEKTMTHSHLQSGETPLSEAPMRIAPRRPPGSAGADPVRSAAAGPPRRTPRVPSPPGRAGRPPARRTG